MRKGRERGQWLGAVSSRRGTFRPPRSRVSFLVRPALESPVRRHFAIAAVALLGAACGGKAAAGTPAPVPAAPQSLAGLAGEQVIVLPTRFLRNPDSAWSGTLDDRRKLLASVDSALQAAVRERGAAPRWTWSDELTRLARRNAAYVPNPHDVAAEPLRLPMRRGRNPDMLTDPLRSQLRSLAALRDARYALVPVELRLESRGGGTGRAVLHLALVDTRLAQPTWMGDISMDVPVLTPALAAGLGERFADLIAAP